MMLAAPHVACRATAAIIFVFSEAARGLVHMHSLEAAAPVADIPSGCANLPFLAEELTSLEELYLQDPQELNNTLYLQDPQELNNTRRSYPLRLSPQSIWNASHQGLDDVNMYPLHRALHISLSIDHGQKRNYFPLVQDVPKSHHSPKEVNPERVAKLEKERRKKHNITAPKVERSLKGAMGKTGQKVVIIHGKCHDEPVCEYMYEPFVKTITDGFSHVGSWTVTAVPPSQATRTDLESTLTTLGPGDILVFVGGVGKGTFLDAMYTNATSLMRETGASGGGAQYRDFAQQYNFKELRKSGVLTIFYNTDAAFECPLTSGDPVDELWDFSHHNIDNCQEQGNGPATIRYVPPGYLGDDAPTTSLNGPHGALLHLGHEWWSTCWLELYNHMPGDLTFKSSAWTNKAMMGILKHNNIFLNLHKGDCRRSRNPFAAARASRLLSAGAILISERAYTSDETAYAGLVDFVEFDNIPTKYAQYYAQDSVTFDNLRTSRRTTFQGSFAPSVLFTNAGVYPMMTARR